MSSAAPLRLIGNPEENFYVLGKKHIEQYKIFRQRLFGSLTMGQHLEILSKRVKKTEPLTLPNNFWGQWLKAYCEGLEVGVSDYLDFLRKIESSALLCGSNTLFTWDKNLQTTHILRTIDWPLHLGAQTDLLYIQVPKTQSLIIQTVQGLPFIPLTIMNSNGLSLGLHRKFATLPEPEGDEIGHIAIEVMMNAKDCIEARKYLKLKKTLQHWGFVFIDKSHEILALDMAGPQVDVIQTTMPQNQNLCFNAAPLVKNKSIIESEPSFFAELCRRQKQAALKSLETKKDHPLEQMTKIPKHLSPQGHVININTISALKMTPTQSSLEVIQGQFPAWNQGEIIEYKNIFEDHMRSSESKKITVNEAQSHFWSAHHHLSLAQKFYDEEDFTAAFHHLQMGIASGDDTLKSLGEWVLRFWNWTHLKGVRVRLLEYRELMEIEKSHRTDHSEHIKLLKLLYEMELNLAPTVTTVELGEKLKSVADRALMGPSIERGAFLKKIKARLDFQDLVIMD